MKPKHECHCLFVYLAVVVATFSFAGRALHARLAGAAVQLVLRLREARVHARMTALEKHSYIIQVHTSKHVSYLDQKESDLFKYGRIS